MKSLKSILLFALAVLIAVGGIAVFSADSSMAADAVASDPPAKELPLLPADGTAGDIFNDWFAEEMNFSPPDYTTLPGYSTEPNIYTERDIPVREDFVGDKALKGVTILRGQDGVLNFNFEGDADLIRVEGTLVIECEVNFVSDHPIDLVLSKGSKLLLGSREILSVGAESEMWVQSTGRFTLGSVFADLQNAELDGIDTALPENSVYQGQPDMSYSHRVYIDAVSDDRAVEGGGKIASLRFVERLPSEPGTIKTGATISITKAQDRPDVLVREIDFSVAVDADAFMKYLLQNHNTEVLRTPSGELDKDAFILWFSGYMANRNSVLPCLSIELNADNYLKTVPVGDSYTNNWADAFILSMSVNGRSFDADLSIDTYKTTAGKNAAVVNEVSMLRLDSSLSETASVEFTADAINVIENADPSNGIYNSVRAILGKTAVSMNCDAASMLRCIDAISGLSDSIGFTPYDIQDIYNALTSGVYTPDLLDGLSVTATVDSLTVNNISQEKAILDGTEAFAIRDGTFGYMIDVKGFDVRCNFTDAAIKDLAPGEFLIGIDAVEFNPVGNYVTDMKVGDSDNGPVSLLAKKYLPNNVVPTINEVPGGLCCKYLAVEYSNLTEIAGISVSGTLDKNAYSPLLAILLGFSDAFDPEIIIIEDLTNIYDESSMPSIISIMPVLFGEADFDVDVTVASIDSIMKLKMGAPYWTTPEESATKEAKYETSDKWFFTICDKTDKVSVAGISMSLSDDQIIEYNEEDPDDGILDVSASVDSLARESRLDLLGFRSIYQPDGSNEVIVAPAMMHSVTGMDEVSPATYLLDDLRLSARGSINDLMMAISLVSTGEFPGEEFDPTFGLYLDVHIGSYTVDELTRDADNGVNSHRDGLPKVDIDPRADETVYTLTVTALDLRIDSDSDPAAPFVSVTANADLIELIDDSVRNRYTSENPASHTYEVDKNQNSSSVFLDDLAAELYLDMGYTDFNEITKQEIYTNVVETLFFLLLPDADAQCVTTFSASAADIIIDGGQAHAVEVVTFHSPLPQDMDVLAVTSEDTHVNNELSYDETTFMMEDLGLFVVNDNKYTEVSVSLPFVEFLRTADVYQNVYQSLRSTQQVSISDLNLDAVLAAGDYYKMIKVLLGSLISGSEPGPIEFPEAEISVEGRLSFSEMSYLDDTYIHTYIDVLPNVNLGTYALNAGKMQVLLMDFSIGSPSATAQNPAVDLRFAFANVTKTFDAGPIITKTGTFADMELRTLSDTSVRLKMVTTDGAEKVPSGKGYDFAVMTGGEYTVDFKVLSPNLDIVFDDAYGFKGNLEKTLADAYLHVDADISEICLTTVNCYYDETGRRSCITMTTDMTGLKFVYDGRIDEGFALSGNSFIMPMDAMTADSLRLFFDFADEGTVDLTYSDLVIVYTGGDIHEMLIEAASVTGNMFDVSNKLDSDYRCLGDILRIRGDALSLTMSDVDFPAGIERTYSIEPFLMPIVLQKWSAPVIDSTMSPSTVVVSADIAGLLLPFYSTDIYVDLGTVNGVEVPVGTEIAIGGDSRFNGVNANGMEILGNSYRVAEGDRVELVVRYVLSLDYGYGGEIGTLLYDEGDVISIPTPVRDGYTFDGWLVLDGGEYVPFDLTVMPANDLRLKAQWAPVAFTLTYDFEGFETIATTVFEVDCGAVHSIISAVPEKEGYTFCGWKYRSDTYCASGSPYSDLNDLTMPAYDVTLTPIWEKAIVPSDFVIQDDLTTLDINGDRLNMGADVSQNIAANDSITSVEIIFRNNLNLSMSKESLNLLSGGSGASNSFGLQATSSKELGNLMDSVNKDNLSALGNILSVISIDVTGGTEKTSDLGEVTVTLPFEHEVGPGEQINVRYVSDSGEVYEVEDCLYDPVKKTVSFKTTHFSTFAVSLDPILYDVSINPAIVGGTIMVSPSEAAEGAEVEITALPDIGKKVDGISVRVNGTETILPCVDGVFVMPAGDVTVSAVFTDIIYSISADEGIAGGSLAFDVSTAVKGQTVNVTATPDEGMILAGLSYSIGKGAVPIIDGSFVMPAGNVVVTAVFENIIYDITIAGGITGGVIDVLDDQAVLDDKVLVLITPDANKQLKTLTYTLAGREPVTVSGDWFVMPAGDVTVNAVFEDALYGVRSEMSISGGSVQVPVDRSVAGQSITLTVTADEGKRLKSLSYMVDGGEPIAISGDSFVMPKGDVTVGAVFEDIPGSGSGSGSDSTPLIIGGVIGVLAIVGLAVFFIRKH